ncbi:MAG: heavy metal response regulator transcription factor [Pseudobdellovibrionaceae bacterium]
MKLLIVEDQETIAQYLQKGLTESGYIVDLMRDGEEGLSAATSRNYDLIIVDGLLPKLDGWSLVKFLRNSNIQVPILFLSARDEVSDRVKGLECGADCYLVKPFAFTELLAQVRSLLRRQKQASNALITDKLQIDDLMLDLSQHKAYRAGKKLDLTSKEFALLALLMRRRGDVLSRTVIVEQIWDMNFDSDTNVVDVHIRRLRGKVDDPFARKLIQTVRGIGYSIDGEN